MQIGVQVDDGGFGKALTQLLRHTSNLKPVFEEIGSMLQTSAEQRIENEGPGPAGEKWPALAPSTLKRRGEDAKMLRDKGHLVASLTFAASRLSVAVGTNRIYGPIQQLGGNAGRGGSATIPARPFLGVSKVDWKEIGETMTGYLAGGLR